MINSMLLKIAKDRYQTKNELTEEDYNLSMDEFIMKIYVTCDPATYGKAFTTKINKDLPEQFFTVSDGEDNGDLCVTYPKRNPNYNQFFICTNVSGMYMTNLDFETEVKKIFLEGKISYLSKKTKRYTIRNIRPYQNFDYFMLCLVDCDNDFKSEYIVVDKDVITEGEFNLHIMNGTKKSNVKNNTVGKGYTFVKNSWQHKHLIENNKLGNNPTYEGFIKFIKDETIRIDGEFWDWNNHLSKMKWLTRVIKTNEQFVSMYLKSNHPIDLDTKLDVKFMIKELRKNGWKKDSEDEICWKSPIDENYYHGVDFSYKRMLIENKLKTIPLPFRK